MFFFIFFLFDIFLLLDGRRVNSCDLNNSSKVDCGYIGISSTQCTEKGCCWVPGLTNDVPWCYHPDGNCFLMDNDPKQAPFSESDINDMFGFWVKNFDIEGKGGVCAAPSYTTSCSAGSYYYHWMRDSGLSTRAMMLFQDFGDYENMMKDYVQFVLKIQSEPDPNNIDVRIEPKFTLPDGDVYTGGWCRPQSDGPAIRSSTLILFAQNLIKNGQKDYVNEYLWRTDSQYNGGAIKYDLAWVGKNWDSYTCNLWEDRNDTDFFWNQMHFALSLKEGSEFADQMGDKEAAKFYQQQFTSVNSTIYPGHWNGQYLFEVKGRPLDASVIIALNHYNIFPQNSYFVASTVKNYADFFCSSFGINQQDTTNEVPGVLFGRYESDTYCQGNPWILTSAGLAELFYRASILTLQKGLPEQKAVDIWTKLFSASSWSTSTITKEELSSLFLTAGDSVLKRIAYHTNGAGFHLSEQLDKNTGYEVSADDLTWSYSNTLRANYYRNLALGMK